MSAEEQIFIDFLWQLRSLAACLMLGQIGALYVARYCFGSEEIASYVSMTVIIPTIIGAVMAVELCKKYDKFKVFYISYCFSLYFWES